MAAIISQGVMATLLLRGKVLCAIDLPRCKILGVVRPVAGIGRADLEWIRRVLGEQHWVSLDPTENATGSRRGSREE